MRQDKQKLKLLTKIHNFLQIQRNDPEEATNCVCVPLVGINAVWLDLEKRHRRDARPQPDLIPSSLFGSPHDLLCEPREERSDEWIFDDDAQLLGSRLML